MVHAENILNDCIVPEKRFAIRVSTMDCSCQEPQPTYRIVTDPQSGRPLLFTSRLDALQYGIEHQDYLDSFGEWHEIVEW